MNIVSETICEKRNQWHYNQIMNNLKEEKLDAIRAGRNALESLYEVRNELKGAKTWGLWDILGGGGFVSFIKYMKLDKASSCCYKARRDLQKFQYELNDVLFLDRNLDFNISAILTFLDFFSDDVVSDYLVQREINKALVSVDEAISTVKNIIDCLQ